MNRLLFSIKRFWTSGIIIRGKEALKEDPRNIRTTKKAWWHGRVARGLGLSATALATVLLAVAPASGAPEAEASTKQWKYAFHVRGEGNSKAGDAHGWLVYTTPDRKGCSRIGTHGNLRDLAADGRSIILYVRLGLAPRENSARLRRATWEVTATRPHTSGRARRNVSPKGATRRLPSSYAVGKTGVTSIAPIPNRRDPSQVGYALRTIP